MPAIISRKELEYNESQAPIPVDFVELDKRGLVHVWAKNTGPSKVKLGVAWRVTDPDGLDAEWYSDEEFGTTGPGEEHRFIGGRFDLSKQGVYRIFMAIYIITNGWTVPPADEYIGDLCTVGVSMLQGFAVASFSKV